MSNETAPADKPGTPHAFKRKPTKAERDEAAYVARAASLRHQMMQFHLEMVARHFTKDQLTAAWDAVHACQPEQK